jgi:hypothetical protein
MFAMFCVISAGIRLSVNRMRPGRTRHDAVLRWVFPVINHKAIESTAHPDTMNIRIN